MKTPRDAYQQPIADAIRRATCAEITWGIDDCLMWLADIYLQVLGVDPAAPYRGRYKTPRGAVRVMGKAGVPGVLGETTLRMGWPPILPASATTGDLGTVVTADGPGGAIFGGEFWVGRVEFGFTAYRTGYVGHAWHVPALEPAADALAEVA